MFVVLCMAGIAIFRCAGINAVDMTGGAIHAGMFSRQREGGSAVIERGGFPGRGGVTGVAVRSKLPAMRIVLGMTGRTGGWCSLESFVGVALRARNADMRAG